MKYGMIKEALTLAKLGKTSQYETLKEVQKTTGKSLYETAEFLAEGFSKQITPEDYDEWIRQVVLHSEGLKKDGSPVRLNKRSVFNDLLGDVLENDPMGKVNLGDEQLTKHVFDATWKRYQGTRDHLKATKVMKAREEEEALHRSSDANAERMAYKDRCYDCGSTIPGRHTPLCDLAPKNAIRDLPQQPGTQWWAGAKGTEDEELNVNVPPQPEETDEFRPSSGAERYDDEDMSFRDEQPTDDVEMNDRGVDDMEGGMADDHVESEIDALSAAVDNPHEEGTPEGDAWTAGFEAAIRAHEESESPEEERAEHEGDDLGQEVSPDEGGDSPFDIEAIEAGDAEGDVEQTDGVDYEAGEVDSVRPQENEERSVMRRSDAPWLERNLAVMRNQQKRNQSRDLDFTGPDHDPQSLDFTGRKYQYNMLDSMVAKHQKALANAQRSTEDEERARVDWASKGYNAAKAEYHHGRKPTSPTSPMERRKWNQGYESFMKDTEGQRDLKRKGAVEDEESSTVKSFISKPKDTINQALKSVEDEGSTAFDKIKMPDNPHPTKSLAQRAWSKGFKNAVSDAFGFNKKPDMPRAKKRRK